jgi:hypothetical protein
VSSKEKQKMASIPGTWNVRFGWGCTGSYGSFTATFAANGTWSGSGFAGKWALTENMLMFNFTSGPAVYAGYVAGGSATGAQTTFTGTNGCWFATKAGVAAAKKAGGGVDASGVQGGSKSSKKSSKKR